MDKFRYESLECTIYLGLGTGKIHSGRRFVLHSRQGFGTNKKPPPKGGCTSKPFALPYVHIAGAGRNFHLGAATADRPFQLVMAHRALYGDGQIGVD